MGIRRCENGHYYDDEKFFRCPYCGINIDLEDEILKKVYKNSKREYKVIDGVNTRTKEFNEESEKN